MSAQVLVGRENDLAAVTDLLASGGHRARLVLLEGEAGIGKTWLCHALASAAEARGVDVRWGAGAGDDGAPPYWVWRQLVPDAIAGGDRFELFSRLKEVLEGAGGLLVIDDLPLVDESSVSMLAHLLRSRWAAAPAVLATRRTGDKDHVWQAKVAPLLEGVELRAWTVAGIDRAAVPALCETMGVDLTGTTITSLHAESRGNPLVLRELVAARARGALRTGRYAELVRGRLRALSSGAQILASAAAVVGDPFDLVVAARVCGCGVRGSLSAADELVSAGIWRTLPERPGHLAFGHELTREAVLGGLSLQKQVALHRRAAEVIEHLAGDDAGRAAEIAGHWVAASVTGDYKPVLRWSGVAAQQALEAGAWEEAARLTTRGLDRSGGRIGLSEALLLTTRARAKFLLGQHDDAATDVRQAHRAALAAGRADLATGAALALDPVGTRRWDTALAALLAESLAALPAGADDLRARAHARCAQTAVYLKLYEVAAEHSTAAVEAAGRSQDPEVLIDVLHARQLTHSGPGQVAIRADLADQLIALGRRLDRPAVEIWGHLWAVDVAAQRGDLTALDRAVADAERCTDRVDTFWARWHLLLVKGVSHQSRGRFDEAVDAAGRAFDITLAQERPVIGAFASLMSTVWKHRGPDPSMLARLADVDGPAGEVNGEHFAFVGTAMLLASCGRLDSARQLYQRAGDPRDWQIPPYFHLQLLAVGAQVAMLLGEGEDMAWFRAQLLPLRVEHVTATAGTASYEGPVALVLGQLAAALGDLDTAQQDLSAAVAATVVNGATPFEIESRVRLAEVQAQLGRAAQARSTLGTVRSLAAQLGMAPWLARIDDLLAGEPVLSRREAEVAKLVALGFGNADIARELVLSERTAENHVQHIMTKLDFRNRSQIAAWVSSGQRE